MSLSLYREVYPVKDKLALAGAVLGFLLAAMAIATLTTAIIVLHAEARQEPFLALFTLSLIPICFLDVLTVILALPSAFALLRMCRGNFLDKEQRVPLRVAFWGTLGAIFACLIQISAYIEPWIIALNAVFFAVILAEAIVRILCITRL